MEGHIFWTKPKTEVLRYLGSDESHGLSEQSARKLLARYGYNEFKQTNNNRSLTILLKQLASPLVFILIIAAALSSIRGDLTDTVVILSVVVLNTIIGWAEEFRAQKVIAKLRKILSPQARVIRETTEQKVLARYLVPGDIIKLEPGDRVPADGRILESYNLRVNEASLTGESLPSHKRDGVHTQATALIDRSNMLYQSSLVVSGTAVAVVCATGSDTEVGLIAKEVVEVKRRASDISRKLSVLGRMLAIASVVMALLAFLIGIYRGVEVFTMLETALALLVSLIPEGLPVALTVVLAIGLIRIFRQKAIVRQLSAAETLGSATVICVDKTGTLTEGEMMVEKLVVVGQEYSVTGRGFGLTGSFFVDDKQVHPNKVPALNELLVHVSLSTTSALSPKDLHQDKAKELTDPTETALTVLAAKAGIYAFSEERRYPEVLELPFNQLNRYQVGVHLFDKHYRYFVRGAPEEILKLSRYELTSKLTRRRLTVAQKNLLEQRAESYAKQGYRVVAIGYEDRPLEESPGPTKIHDLIFSGLLIMSDPIRPSAKKTIDRALQAGIKVMIITGDHLLTAIHVGERLGLGGDRAIHADEINHRDLDNISIIARATPSDKLKIIDLLQKRGEIVAMTGDGVNDAPALKKADIGIAMGRHSTDVAIEAADMVLLENDFGAIVGAVEEGRLMWENLKKVVFYLTSTSIAEVTVLIVSVMFNLPLPLIAVQILWLNLVTDGVTSLALTGEAAEENLMRRKPRDPKDQLIDTGSFARIALISLAMCGSVLFAYLVTLNRGQEYARAAVLTTFAFAHFFNLFNCRSATRSVFAGRLTVNKVLLWLFGLGVVAQLLALYYRPLSNALSITSLDWQTLVICVILGLSVIFVDEWRKLMRYLIISWVKFENAFS